MRFLLCSLDNPGFLFPSVGLAVTLQKRGHEVAFASDSSTHTVLEKQGIRRIPVGPGCDYGFKVASWFQAPAVADQLAQIEQALQQFPADAIGGQALTLGPLLAAERHRLPVGIMGFCTYLWPARDESGSESAAAARRAWRHTDMIQWWNQARAHFDLPPYQGGVRETPLLGDLFLLRSVRQMEPDFEHLPEQVHLAGGCLWEPEESVPELERWLLQVERSGRPLIYVQHGRSFHLPGFWPALVEALAGLDCWVVASTDRQDRGIGKAALSSRFFTLPHVSQGRCLRSARLTIASANTTAVLGSLTEGVPCLLIPGGGEQPDLAEACERMGVAKVLSMKDSGPQQIRGAIEELLAEGPCRERARDLSRVFGRASGFDRAADLFERLAQTRGPVRRAEFEEEIGRTE